MSTSPEAEYCLEEVLTYGVCNGKYGGYSVPLKLPEEIAKEIEGIANEHGASQKFYGDGGTIYLRCDQLTEKQREELLNQGRMIARVKFSITGVRERNNEKRLCFSLLQLRKVRKALDPPPLD